MRKYLIDNKVIFTQFGLGDYIEEKYRLQGKEVKRYWFAGYKDKKEISGPIYFELRSDLKNPFDYSILKRETLEVIDFISENFNIHKKLIKIYFNSKDGFYLVISAEILGIGNTKNIRSSLNKLAEYIKLKLDSQNLRLDIYELDSYHIEFNTENKSTGLFLVNLSIESLMKYTYKELIKYASNKREEEFYEIIDFREVKPKDCILEVMQDIDKVIDFEKWIEGYTNLQLGINKEAVKELYLMCENIEMHKGLIDEAKEYYNRMLIQGNRFEGEEKEDFFRSCKYDLIMMLVNYLYIRDSKYEAYILKDEYSIPYKHRVIAEVRKGWTNPILYFDENIIGNEDMFIEIDELEHKSFEELIEIVATVYKYLENTYER